MANFELGNLVWKITGDTAGFDKNIKNANTSATGLGSKLKKIGAVAVSAFAIKKVLDFGQAIITAASDAEETQNKFNVVFQDVAENAERQAELLSKSYGLAQTESQALLADTADLLQGFGITSKKSLELSTNVQKLAVDLASFTNFSGGAAGASQALTKALLGETEGVKALGIAITQSELKTLAEEQGLVFEELTKGEKALLTYELAVTQSKNAIGDFARSSDSFANQQRILNAEIQDIQTTLGTAFLPIVNDLLGVFIEFIRENEDLIISLGEALVPVVKLVIDALSGVLRIASKVLGFLTDGARASDGFSDSLKKQREEQEKINDLLERAEGLKTQAEEIQGLLDIYTELNKKSDLTVGEQEKLQGVIKDLGKVLPSAVTEWDEYGNAVAVNANTANSAIDSILEARKKLLEASKARLAAQVVQAKAIKASIQDELEEARLRRDELVTKTQEQTLILAEAEKIRAERINRGNVSYQERKKLDLEQLQRLADLGAIEQRRVEDAKLLGNANQQLLIILQDLARNEDVVSDALGRQIEETNKLEDQYLEAEKITIEYNATLQELNSVNNQLANNTATIATNTRDRTIAEAENNEVAKESVEIANEKNEQQKELNNLIDETTEATKELQAADEEELKTFQDVYRQKQDLINNLIGKTFDITNQLYDNEIERIEQSSASEEEKAKKISQIKKDQAIAERAGALFSIAIETAKNIAEAFPVIPLQIAAGALGAIQAAAVIAQPIPKFANGGIVPESPSAPNTGDNVLARLNPGEEVLTRDDPRHRFNGGGGITIIQNNTLNTDTQTNLERAARVLTPQIQREMSRRG